MHSGKTPGLSERMFSGQDLKRLLIPLIVEQLLTALMGMVDTMMVSNVGEAAVSAVSLVDSINLLMIYLLTALATGGTIVCSQYLGRRDEKMANHAARQLLLVVLCGSLLACASCLILRRQILQLAFGSVEPAIMQNALGYFLFTAMSYPFLGVFDVGAALCRAEGDSRTPMLVSLLSNLLNIAGNSILIFGFGMGAVGAAIATLASRVASAVMMLWQARRPNQCIVLNRLLQIRPDRRMIRMILRIGVPAGFENGLFQFGKVIMQSTVATLSTTAISAQAIISTLEGATSMPSQAIGLGMITVVGQCMGAGRVDEARYYTKRLMMISELLMVGSLILFIAVTQPVTILAKMSAEAAAMMWRLNIIIFFVKIVIWVPSFTLPNGLRAAGDVKFCALVSSLTMWSFRVCMSWVLCRYLGFGLLGIWLGWFTDWLVRAIVFIWRYRSGRWAEQVVLST